MSYPLLELASNIVMAQARYTYLSPEEIAEGLRTIVGVLQSLQAIEIGITGNHDHGTAAKMRPSDSIQPQRVICLECHQAFQFPSGSHLALHGMTSRDYKRKYGLPLSQPLWTRSCALAFPKLTKKRGLGTKSAPSQKKVKANTVRLLRLVR